QVRFTAKQLFDVLEFVGSDVMLIENFGSYSHSCDQALSLIISRKLSAIERKMIRPSLLPRVLSLARSGCGISPMTLRWRLQMPAIFLSDPLTFAASAISPCWLQ